MPEAVNDKRAKRRASRTPFLCHVVARGLELSPRQQALIRREAAKLGQFYDRILEARVVVTTPHRRLHREAVEYAVRIYLTVPRGELVVRRQTGVELLTALQDAFRAAGRVLQDHAARIRSPLLVKRRAPAGEVTSVFPYQGFGFLAGPDGSDIYFHRNAVAAGRFDRIEVGDRVRFAEAEGNEGPQASVVIAPKRRRR